VDDENDRTAWIVVIVTAIIALLILAGMVWHYYA
jgi:hypothetical protein